MRTHLGRYARLAWLGSAALLLASAPRTLGASHDWPQWQGPDRNAVSHETGLLKQWPEGGPPLLWRAGGLGAGYSTVSVADGRIYTMGDLGPNECVLALDENHQGKILWSTPMGAAKPNGGGGYPGARSTPTVDGNSVYALGISGELACLDAANGTIRWSRNLAKDFGGHMMSMWGFSESPLIDGDQLICTPGSSEAALVALNKHNGEVIWKSAYPNPGGAGYASVVVADVDGIRQYVQLLGRAAVGVDAKTGKLLWQYKRVANRTANIPTPIVRGNLVFCSTGYNTGSALLKLTRNGDGIEAKEVYFLSGRVLQNHHGGLVLVGDYVYGGHGNNAGAPTCVNLETGKVMWQEHAPGSGSAAVLAADGELYFRYQDGVLALIDANPQHYRLRSQFRLPDQSGKPSWPHPVIANGRLYIRDQDTLLCFDVKQH